ncbi:hypothetical protein VST63_29200 [Mycolicibacterium sp. 050232]|uniref:hypothetical protein n=1 Tax=Mycolicibacterium sp. 050232 TaxID=3113982 RepID=UPI002E296BCC|nr:hypothetical protein [Mycolicibacterium sp. 050232]MED5816457.1 hypothetical protein [Mycolicibacterium sp. 050232]
MPVREGERPRDVVPADAEGVAGVGAAAGAVAAAWVDSAARPGGSSDPGGSPVAARRQDGVVPDAASAGRDVRAMR